MPHKDTQQKKHPGGRPTLYKPEYADQAFKYCLLGATDEELAAFFEVDERTINRWKNDYPEFCQALKEGKEKADANVADRLYNRAMGYTHKETVTTSYQGQITDTKEIDKHYPPDTTAAIFWLKNRQPKKWRDRVEHTGADGGPIAIADISDDEKLALIQQVAGAEKDGE